MEYHRTPVGAAIGRPFGFGFLRIFGKRAPTGRPYGFFNIGAAKILPLRLLQYKYRKISTVLCVADEYNNDTFFCYESLKQNALTFIQNIDKLKALIDRKD